MQYFCCFPGMPITTLQSVLVCLSLLTFRFRSGAWQLEDKYIKSENSFFTL